MKLNRSLLTILVLMLITVPLFSQLSLDTKQTTFSNGLVIEFAGQVDSSGTYDTLITKEFVVTDYDNNSWLTEPPSFQIIFSGGTASTQKVSCYLLGSNKNDADFFTVVDTICYKDSAITLLNKTFSTYLPKYTRYKLKFCGETGNKYTDFEAALYFWKKD